MTASTDQVPAPFVCFGGVDWWYHSRAHSDVQLMLALARERRVLFVNSIGMRMPSAGRGSSSTLRKIARKIGSTMRWLRRPRQDLPNFFVFSPLLLPFYGNARMRRWNARLIRAQLRVVQTLLGIRKPHVVVTVPTAWDVAKDLPKRSLTYNRSDKHSAFAEADQALISSLEHELLTHSDRIVYVSESLLESERQHTEERAHFLDHGVDLELFAPQGAAEPADIARIPHPRIGFFGSLRSHLVDLELLEKTARELPDTQLVLVGAAPDPIDSLARLPNVHWLGPCDHTEIPAYGRAFDVALMPYRDNDWIAASNPIKLKEYLALGLPIVSTNLPAARRYGELIRITEAADAFVAEVRSAARTAANGADKGPQLRRAAVADSSWQSRAASLADLVET